MTLLDRLKPSASSLIFVFGTGTFLAFLGPYQTGGLGWPWVWFYWTGLMAVGAASNVLSRHFMDPVWKDWPDWAAYGLASVLIALPVSAAVYGAQALAGPAWPLEAIQRVFFVWVISAGATVLAWLGDRRKEAEAAGEEARAGRALTDKLPPHLKRARIYAMAAEDHYLRVHTEAGEALILMRLSDAVAAVEGLDGARTHRSWWVARDAVQRVERGDGRAVLTLVNGVEAPVSRTYSKALREAGWY